MLRTRRSIAVLVGCAMWCIAASSVAYAVVVDPGTGSAGTVTSAGSSGRPLWQVLGLVALGVLVAAAIVGLAYSLSHSRRSEASTSSQTPLRS